MLRYRCPASFNTPEIAEFFMAYSLLESGILPAAGGWTDQSATFVAAVGVVNGERHGEIERQKAAQGGEAHK